jgi:hypothetical protein
LEQVAAGPILSRTAALLRGDLLVAAMAVLLLSGLGTVLDLARGSDGSGGLIVDSVAGVLAQYLVTKHLIKRTGLTAEGTAQGQFGAVLRVWLLSGIGIVLGFLLLVVPGVFLWIRWFAGVPVAIARGEGAMPALRDSWDMTRGSEWAILAVSAVIYAPFIIMLAVAVLLLDAAFPIPVVTMIANATLYGSMVAGWYAAIAFLELRKPTAGKLEQVFA